MRAIPLLFQPLWLGLLLCPGCGNTAQEPATRAQLRQAFERAPLVEIQLADGAGRGSVHLEAAGRAARVLGERCNKRVEVSESVRGSTLDVPRIVLGTLEDPGVQELVERLGGPFSEADSTRFRRVGQRFLLSGEDPDRPGRPLVVHLAADWRTLLAGMENLAPRLAPGASGVAQRTGRVEWPTAGQQAAAIRAPRWDARGGNETVRLHWSAGVSEARVERYHAKALGVIAALEAWSGGAIEEPLDLLFCARPFEFRALAGRGGLSALEDLPATRLVLLASGLPDDGAACVARWASAELFGPTPLNWLLDGAAVDAAGEWWGQELAAWGQWLAAGQLLPSVEQLTSNASVDQLSQHQLAPARGLFFRFLRSEHDGTFLRALWDGRESLALEEDLEQRFHSWLGAQPVAPIGRAPGPRLPAEFQAGVALASNAAAGGGFDGDELRESLSEAAGLGINSLSITSFFEEHPGLRGARVPAGRECLEGDIAIAYAVAEARAAGLAHITLQTHLLLSSSAGYSSWQRRTDSAHWAAFFDELDPCLVHYGLLAQLCSVDLLCIGTRITRANRRGGLDPQVEQFCTQRLGRSIERVRGAFAGALTYAADWRWEAAHFDLWAQLDYIGLSLFWNDLPAGAPRPGQAELRAHWHSTLEILDGLARDLGKPVLVLETGVPSVSLGTARPRVGGGALDLEPQQQFWQALGDALGERRAQGQSSLASLAGLYAWKWGASPESGGERDRSFHLQGKPAALQLPRLSARD